MDCKPCEKQIMNENEIGNNITTDFSKFLFAPIPENNIFEKVDTNLPEQKND